MPNTSNDKVLIAISRGRGRHYGADVAHTRRGTLRQLLANDGRAVRGAPGDTGLSEPSPYYIEAEYLCLVILDDSAHVIEYFELSVEGYPKCKVCDMAACRPASLEP